MSQSSDSFSSLQNALRVLNLFNVDDSEYSITEISRIMGIGKSTAHRLVSTLLEEGILAKDTKTNNYRLGASLLSLGKIITSQKKVYEFSLPILQKLVDISNETAHLIILKKDKVVYIHKIECNHPVRLLSHIGKHNPAHCTSSGQAILAFQQENTIQYFLKHGLQQHTDKTITDPHIFMNKLRKIKLDGYAISVEELHKGVTSIAAPIYNHLGVVVASINIAGPIQRITLDRTKHLTKYVVLAAEEISKKLGYRS